MAYFRKVTLIESSMFELQRFTRSPRFYRLFKKTLSVIKLSDQSKRVHLPPSRQAWAATVHNAFRSAGIEIPRKFSVQETSEFLAKYYSPSKSRSISSHCECKLLQYFVTQRHSIPPINYIGVSKLSCAACQAVFDAYNLQTANKKHRYYTRGSHEKWYFPWCLPDLDFPGGMFNMESFRASVYQKLAGAYAEYIESAARSDSSALSFEERTKRKVDIESKRKRVNKAFEEMQLPLI
jgi:hypothetical protein